MTSFHLRGWLLIFLSLFYLCPSGILAAGYTELSLFDQKFVPNFEEAIHSTENQIEATIESAATLSTQDELPTVVEGANGCIGNFTWVDCDGNGIYDDGEPGLAGVQVALYTAAGSYQAATVTDPNGNYQFDDLETGISYYLIFSGPSGYGYTAATGAIGDQNNNDAGANGQTADVFLAEDECNLNVDAGFAETGSPGITSAFPEICAGESLEVCITETWAAYQWYLAVDAANPDPANDILLSGSTDACYYPETSGAYYAVVEGLNCPLLSPTREVTVYDLPLSSLEVDEASAFCEGESTQLLASPAGEEQYDFYWNAVTLMQSGPDNALIAEQPGTYEVVVTNQYGCTYTTESVSIETWTIPDPLFELDGPETFCEGGTVLVSVQDIWDNYEWIINGQSAANGANWQYQVTENATVQVIVTSSDGCIGESNEIEVSVNPEPVPSIYAQTAVDLCEGEEVMLTVGGTYTSYQWYLDGMAISPGGNGQLVYASVAGDYTIYVNDFNGCEGTSLPTTVTVEPLPVATLDAPNGLTACANEAGVLLTATAGFPAYDWYKDNALLVQSGPSDNYTATASGTYTVIPKNSLDCEGTGETLLVEIFPLPIIDLDYTDTVICPDGSVELSASAGVQYQWSPDDGSLSCATCETTFASPSETTTYTVEVTNENGCTSSRYLEITVLSDPANSIIAMESVACDGQSIAIIAAAGADGYTFFDENNTIVQDGTTNQFLATEPGLYTCLVSTMAGCTELTEEVAVSFLPLPQVEVTTDGPFEICPEGELVLEATPGYQSYTWYHDFSLVSNAETETLVAAGPGFYYVVVEDDNGCINSSDIVDVDVLPWELPGIALLTDPTVCGDQIVALSATGDYATLQWLENGEPISGETNPILEADHTGSYAVQMTTADGCVSSSIAVDLLFAVVPEVEIIFPYGDKICEGQTLTLDIEGEPIYTIDWYHDGQVVQAGFIPEYTTNIPGEYFVEVMSADSCYAVSQTVDIQVAACEFDLALTKQLSIGQASPVYPGDQVTYTIEVHNQADLDAQNIQLIDYIPAGMQLDDPNWTIEAGNTATYTMPVLSGFSTATVDITLLVEASASAGIVSNAAEITYAEEDNGSFGSDLDSTADDNPNNDGTPIDNVIDGANGDEDDHDIAEIEVAVFDLALTKTLSTGQAANVAAGAPVTFDILVYNQGSIPATDIQLIDYIPYGLTLNDANWSMNGVDAVTTIAGPIAAGGMISVPITLMVDAGFTGTEIINYAEIASAKDGSGNSPMDADSSPDMDSANDAGGQYNSPADDETEGDGTGIVGGSNAATDEDDHDGAGISIDKFDLALTKTLASGQSASIVPGEDITFTITIWNQAQVDAYEVEVLDYLPTGFVLNDASWTMAGPNAKKVIAGPIVAGGMTSFDITLTALAGAQIGDHANYAEIAYTEGESGTNPIDLDSSADSSPANDAGGATNTAADDAIDGDGTGSPGDAQATTDEDDHDGAAFEVVELFDLALTKQLATGQENEVSIGDQVTFTISIENQGNIDAQNVLISDYLPVNLQLDDAAWNMNGTAAEYLYSGTIAPAEVATIDITTTVLSGFAEVINTAEISAAHDATGQAQADYDSTPDADPANDLVDEDDFDQASFSIREQFDLALTKTLATTVPGPYHPGTDIDFVLTVINQGNVPAYDVELIDYIPSGLLLNDIDWTQAGSNAIYSIEGPIAVGDMEQIEITLAVGTDNFGELSNYAEISAAHNQAGQQANDEDSNFDNDNTNDGAVEDNETSGLNGDEDDHDLEMVTTEPTPVYDLALTKQLAFGQPAIVNPGDDVTFTLSVHNQGNRDVYNIELVDYIPVGFVLNDENWQMQSTEAVHTIAGPLAPNEVASVDIVLEVTAPTGDLSNYAEISDFEAENGTHPDDADSVADSNNTNDGPVSDDDIDSNNGDEDDHDVAMVTVEAVAFDLALSKSLPAGQPTNVAPGDELTFEIVITNQGTVAAYNIDLIDYLPAGLALNDSDWTMEGGNAIYTIPGPLNADEELLVEITTTVTATENGQHINIAEITDAEDDEGEHPADMDSSYDSNPDNDAGAYPGSAADDYIAGDGTGSPGDTVPATDEDDHDPAIINVVPIAFDLALAKQLAPNQSAQIANGDDVTYRITVLNQGNIDAHNIEVIDYIPSGFVLNDPNWTQVGDNALLTIEGPLTGGSSAVNNITLRAVSAAGLVSNYAEIASAQDATGEQANDVDSNADSDNSNDAGGAPNTQSDNTVNGDGTGQPGGQDAATDEDDHDPATVEVEVEEPIFDLALSKKLAATQANTVTNGDDVQFTITVYNQGEIPAYNVEVIDYLPSGLTLNDASWTMQGANAITTIAGPIAPGGNESVDITLTTSMSGTLRNIAEVASAQDSEAVPQSDEDSTADSNSSNDGNMLDDEIDGAGSDEDDSDYAEVNVQEVVLPVFDLALNKSLATGQAATVSPGETVEYTITITNEGEAEAYNISIIDYLPTGFVLSDSDWTTAGASASILLPGPIAAGASLNTNITLTAANTAGTYSNRAEISSAEDIDGPAVDTDSTAGNGLTDEDDYDEQDILIEEEVVLEFDLSLTKQLTSGQSQVKNQGDQVSYDITVFNEGDIDAYDVELIDYLPAGLSLDDSNWIMTGNGAMLTISEPVLAGESVTVQLNATVDIVSGTLSNSAEIASAADASGMAVVDTDSSADTDDSNDLPTEDDRDSAQISVVEQEVFDLALNKIVAAGQSDTYTEGQDVSFEIRVSNQGNVDAWNVKIADYVPSGLILNDSNWTMSGSHAEMVLDGPIEAGMSETVQITMTVATGAGDLVNVAEIADAQDALGNHPIDVDSNFDIDNTNDGPVTDDVTDGTNGDEDDSDPAAITVVESNIYDLALLKQLAFGQSGTVSQGDEVSFTITVFNQGNVAAFDVVLVDYIPSGFTLNDLDWTSSGSFAFATLPGPIAPGQSVSMDITMTASVAGGVLSNLAEISSASDENGLAFIDIDSTPDNDPMNDGLVIDDVTDGLNGDEDDSDIAEVLIEALPTYDLALIKTLAAGQSDTGAPGDNIQYSIQVINQGTDEVYNVELIDYLPNGLILNDDNWISSGSNAYHVIAGPIAPGATATVELLTTIDPLHSGGQLANYAEISQFTDQSGIPLNDIDSTPDADAFNDGNTEDDSIDGQNNDEDDHDLAMLQVQVFDLALTKTLANGQPAVVAQGDEVVYIISLYNQGTVAAYNIDIVDYLPEGLTLNDPDWMLYNDNAVHTYTGPLPAGGSAAIPITFIASGSGQLVTNGAEITDAEDMNGFAQEDIDSTADENPDNDGTATDNVTDNSGGDEDDADLESITISDMEIFDLALSKSLATGQEEEVNPGDAITYEITVYNQGNVAAQNIQVVDYIPEGLSLSDEDWYLSGNIASINLPGVLAAGASQSVEITMTALSPEGLVSNIAEIADAMDTEGNQPSDFDSTADTDAANDGPMTDDNLQGFNGDEDDSDLANITIVETAIFDLALEKLLAPGQDAIVAGGEEVTFLIKVFNQGTLDAYDVVVTDYLPAGLTLSDSDWIDNGDQTVSITEAGPIPAGGATLIPITLTAANIDAELFNMAEISDAQDAEGNHPTDLDSTPDTDPNNDGAVVDGEIDGTGGDEDDSDLEAINIVAEIVNVETFDLALTKKLAAGQASTVYPGEEVTFEITIWNQGSSPAYDVQVIDYIPVGLMLADDAWQLNGNSATTTVPGPLLPASSTSVEIKLTVANFQGEIRNIAEITQAFDAEGNLQDDLDSTSDADASNDGLMTDDAINNSNEDEDDSDYALITVADNEYFDLALEKMLAPGQQANAVQGDEVTYLIKIYNQGTIPAYNVEVIDYLPNGLILADQDWMDNGDNTASFVIAGPVPPSGAALVPVTLQVGNFDGTAINMAEIVSAEDEEGMTTNDIDSSADANPNNDGEVIDGATNNEAGDEDDSDLAAITLSSNGGEEPEPEEPENFDLALVKMLSSTQDSIVVPGDLVYYTIKVYNQGEIAAYNVRVVDYIPAPFELHSTDWTEINGSAVTTIDGPIQPGTNASVEIVLQLNAAAGDGESINFAEIVSAENEVGKEMEDIDSVADVVIDNDGEVKDNETNGDQLDEDDHDMAAIIIDKDHVEVHEADVKLQMTANVENPMPGDLVVYELKLINEGEVEITGLDVMDILPEEVNFVGANSPDYDPNTGLWIAGSLAIGQEKTLEIMAEIAATSGVIVNFAQVSHMDQEDADSAPANGNALLPNEFEDDETEARILMGSCALDYDSTVECSVDGMSYTVIVTLGNAVGDVYVTGDFEGLVQQTFSIGPKDIGSTYSFVATDAAGCTVTETITPPDCVALPIELISFEGEKQNDGNRLHWVSATEVDASYYTLLRSEDGINYIEVATVQAIGNSTVANRYEYLDNYTKAGTTYYQLQQTDLDGQTQDLGIVSIYREAAKLSIIDLHPSPAHDYVDVSFSYEREGLVDIELYDAAGRLVYERKADAVAGTNSLRINLWQFDAGVYFLMISNDKESTVEKLIKQ